MFADVTPSAQRFHVAPVIPELMLLRQAVVRFLRQPPVAAVAERMCVEIQPVPLLARVRRASALLGTPFPGITHLHFPHAHHGQKDPFQRGSWRHLRCAAPIAVLRSTEQVFDLVQSREQRRPRIASMQSDPSGRQVATAAPFAAEPSDCERDGRLVQRS